MPDSKLNKRSGANGPGVFISYHHDQKWWVRILHRELKKLNLRPFFDENDQREGDVVRVLTENILNSKRLMVLITPESVNSEWVNAEIDTWLSEHPSGKGLIPVVLDHVPEPEIPATIRRFHRTDLTGGPKLRKQEYHRLLQELGVKKVAASLTLPLYKRPLPKPSQAFCLAHKGKALAIGAHWDDILLGCFGTLLKLSMVYDYEVKLYVLCSEYGRKYYGIEQGDVRSKVKNIYRELERRRPGISSVLHEAKDQFTGIVDRRFHDASQTLHGLMKEIAHEHEDYNLIFTPPMDDGHEDHAFTGQLVLSYFRKPHQMILEYEIKRYLEKHFVPNIFVRLDEPPPAKFGITASIGNYKNQLLSELVTTPKKNSRTCFLGSEFLFGIESLRARLLTQALNYGGDKNVKYGEAFRGRISL